MPCPTCEDSIMNGLETGVDCGGPECEECEVFVPEPEPGDVCNSMVDEECDENDLSQFDDESEYRPPGCTALDARDCIIRNKYTAQSGAHIENQPWYQSTAEFYPWVPGSRIYNSSHWRECECICKYCCAVVLPASGCLLTFCRVFPDDTGEHPIAIPGQTEPFIPADHGITTGAHTMYGR